MKRKTTKEILAESFRELSAQKAVDKITIREITDNCGYSPATFYRQFKDKYDLIAWDHTRGVAAIMEQIGGDFTWEQALLAAAKWFQVEQGYFANLFLHTDGQDAFVRYMTQIHYEALKKHIRETAPEKAVDEKMAMYIWVYCLGTVSLTCEWILGRYPVPPETLAEVYQNALPAPLARYFNGHHGNNGHGEK